MGFKHFTAMAEGPDFKFLARNVYGKIMSHFNTRFFLVWLMYMHCSDIIVFFLLEGIFFICSLRFGML